MPLVECVDDFTQVIPLPDSSSILTHEPDSDLDSVTLKRRIQLYSYHHLCIADNVASSQCIVCIVCHNLHTFLPGFSLTTEKTFKVNTKCTMGL